MSDMQSVKAARREQRVRIVLLGACAVALLVWMVAGILRAPTKPDTFVNSYSASPGGHRALYELLHENDREVRREARRLKLPAFDAVDGDTLILLEPRLRYIEDLGSEFETLFEAAHNTHSSLVLALPKRHYTPAPRDESGEVVLTESLVPLGDAAEILRRSGFSRWFQLRRLTQERASVFTPDHTNHATVEYPLQVLRPKTPGMPLPANMSVVARTVEGDVVALRLMVDDQEEWGGLVLFSDPDFFSNRYLGQGGMARIAMAALQSAPPMGAVVFDEALHGFSSDATLGYLASHPPGLWVTLSVLLALVFFGWRLATVLRPTDALPQDRAARRYAIEGLARLMERAGRPQEAALRILRRSALVLDRGSVQAHEAGKRGVTMEQPKVLRLGITATSEEEQLLLVAQRVAAKKRDGK